MALSSVLRPLRVLLRPWPLFVLLCLAGLLTWYSVAMLRFPPDTTPEGAYLRVAQAVSAGRPEDFFAYIEEEAQHACFSIGDYRGRLARLVHEAYPEAEGKALLRAQGELAEGKDGPAVFGHYARKEGWVSQLRRDLSGVARVERAGPRATVVTSRGTRYAFRLRPTGIWGLSAFTPLLTEEAERAARDYALVERAAQDFKRGREPRDR